MKQNYIRQSITKIVSILFWTAIAMFFFHDSRSFFTHTVTADASQSAINPTGDNQSALRIKEFIPPANFITCPNSSNIAINFAINVPGSHTLSIDITKLDDLQTELGEFVHNLSTSNLLELETMSSETVLQLPTASYGNNAISIDKVISNLSPRAFNFAKNDFHFLSTSLITNMQKQYPLAKISLIYIADTPPEIFGCDRYQQEANQCNPNQDPSADIQQIKNMGVTIYTIAYVDDPDTAFDTSFATYMQSLATNPKDYYSISTETDVRDDLAAINNKICQ